MNFKPNFKKFKRNIKKLHCINLHFTDKCNYTCKYCFVNKESQELSFDELKYIVDKIDNFFKNNNIKNGRINLAGGEPLLYKNIDNLIDYIASKNIKISIITNGYLLNEEFIKRHINQIETIGISVDSLNHETNIKIGRNCNKKTLSKEKLISICNIIKNSGIKLKINTCLSKFNIKEDFNSFINQIKPDRYKILQMTCKKSDKENQKYKVSKKEIKLFLSKIRYKYVYESKKDLKNSYLIIDSKANIATNNLHKNKILIFEYDLEEAIKILNINYKNYDKRYKKKL